MNYERESVQQRKQDVDVHVAELDLIKTSQFAAFEGRTTSQCIGVPPSSSSVRVLRRNRGLGPGYLLKLLDHSELHLSFCVQFHFFPVKTMNI